MRSSLFFLVGGAIGFACALPQLDDVTDCKDGSALLSCLSPVANWVQEQSCTTSSCVCELIKTQTDCYKNHCPEASIPPEITSSYNDNCGADEGAAGMLIAPGVGLVAGVVVQRVLGLFFQLEINMVPVQLSPYV
ncbi:hypothetical protein V493_03643 [Pseudogymnoascus sp. VKM F-4281 (FW-2241)]|nr:hypothetical protein V493_03643 [Pseudogymnoascus sp. VKM F-4281 (FW-2241)]